ncbi:hypothetical protein HAX54_023826 [Datura stramonium]|uniref:Pentatricopeptide repeat-containing protein n=1 Tax=Datura stramonium TaxID=4076 RepID=A0ABS8UZ29_DATST|nr:hypothetical protein [Datura stramonium]
MDIEPDATIWKALLAACRVHGNTDLAEKASKALFQLEPQDAVPYVMLSNIYSAAGKWEIAAKLRRKMKLKGLNKEPGYSWIEMNGVVHTFISEERSHSKSDEIYSKLDDVIALIKEAGYVPDLNFSSMISMKKEGNETKSSYHSEKGLLLLGFYVPKGVPIRIYKNLHHSISLIRSAAHHKSLFRSTLPQQAPIATPGIREDNWSSFREIFLDSVMSGPDDPIESFVLHDHVMSFPNRNL